MHRTAWYIRRGRQEGMHLRGCPTSPCDRDVASRVNQFQGFCIATVPCFPGQRLRRPLGNATLSRSAWFSRDPFPAIEISCLSPHRLHLGVFLPKPRRRAARSPEQGRLEKLESLANSPRLPRTRKGGGRVFKANLNGRLPRGGESLRGETESHPCFNNTATVPAPDPGR